MLEATRGGWNPGGSEPYNCDENMGEFLLGMSKSRDVNLVELFENRRIFLCHKQQWRNRKHLSHYAASSNGSVPALQSTINESQRPKQQPLLHSDALDTVATLLQR